MSNDHFEEFLSNNTFYSAPSSSHGQAHASTLRNSIQIKHSPSITSLHAKVAGPNEKTSFMKVSPSMKALESILNEKTQSTSSLHALTLPQTLSQTQIVEEDEEEIPEPEEDIITPPQFLSNNPFSALAEPANRESAYSTTSFVTAKSQNSSAEALPQHSHKRSISTIDEMGYSTNDDTPQLSQEATFHDYKQVAMVNSGTDKLKVVEPTRNTVKKLDDAEPVSPNEQDETLIDERSQSTNYTHRSEETMRDVSGSSSTYTSGSNKVFNYPQQPQSRYSSIQSYSSNPKRLPSPTLEDGNGFKKPDVPNPPITPPKPLSMPASSSSPALTLTPDTNYPLSKPAMHQPSMPAQSKRPAESHKPSMLEAAGAPKSTIKKSPHLRSNSTFSLGNNVSSKDTSQASPSRPRHKRSSTLGSLSRLANDFDTEKPAVPEKKKFSFKALFKSKSKNHALNEAAEPKPQKMSSKSFSTSNLSHYKNPPVSSDQSSINQLDEKKSRNNWDSMSTSNSLLNVFRKNKSTDTLHKLNQDTPAEPLPQSTHEPKFQQGFEKVNSRTLDNPNTREYSTPKQANSSPGVAKIPESSVSAVYPGESKSVAKRAFKSNTNINFIREVTDDDYDPYKNGPTLSSESTSNESEAEQDEEYYDEYDSKNLLNNPPKKISNTRYDEEMSLVASPVQTEEIKLTFGSPFEVTYDPKSTDSPQPNVVQAPKSASELSKVTDDQLLATPKTPNGSAADSQLLGEVLFPKSLNAQEVESIVSLERSRSIKSMKSTKRNSFVNYNGSDDNVIQYSGPPPSAPPNPKTGITRSNSILKNSASRRNLNSELYSSIDQVTSQPGDNYDIVNNTTVDDSTLDGDSNFLNGSNVLNQSVDDQYQDFMEFTDFIDVDNLSFSNSPQEVVRASPRATGGFIEQDNSGESPAFRTVESFSVPPLSLSSPSQSTSHTTVEESSLESIPVPMPLAGPPISAKEKVSIPRISLSPSPEIIDYRIIPENERNGASPDGYQASPESGNNDVVEIDPEDDSEYANGSSLIETSPILETAFRTSNSPALDKNGKSTYNNRPISMSFRGLKGPSFGGKLAQHNVRSSDSHQSFNISFGEDSDYSGSGVGGGFGTSEDEEGFASDVASERSYENNKENNFSYQAPSSRKSSLPSTPKTAVPPTTVSEPTKIPKQKSKFGNVSTKDNSITDLPPPPPRKPFSHNRIPSVSDTASSGSSPKSFSSIISRKWKKSPNLAASSPAAFVSKSNNGGVRFSSRIILYDTYNGEEYDRHPDTATCNQLTPLLAQQIRDELNTFKSEMEIHSSSRCYTHFF